MKSVLGKYARVTRGIDMNIEIVNIVMNGDEETICRLRADGKPCLIYGCANHAELVCNYLYQHGLEVEAYVVDKKYWKQDFYIGEKCVKKLEDYLEILDVYNIVIGFCDVDKSRFLMDNLQLLRCNFWLFWEPLTAYEWNEEYIRKNWDMLSVIWGHLSDELSKRIMEELIWAKLNNNGKRLLKLADSRQYFNELTFTADSEEEVYVDCGAFNGDTVVKYASFVGGKYKKIYAFEPSEKNVLELKENVHYLSNVEVINKGSWKEETILEFEDDGSASQIVEKGRIQVSVTTIDKTVKGEKVTFIKMDVEGSELESLEGAVETIRRNFPKLAICCYHKKDDIVNLYHYISNFNNEKMEYHFYLRHHSNSAYETVLYAIPVRK